MSIESLQAIREVLDEIESGDNLDRSQRGAVRRIHEILDGLIEEGQKEMGVWGAENAQRNAERRADRQERERQARTEDLNASAHPNRVTLDELRRQGRG